MAISMNIHRVVSVELEPIEKTHSGAQWRTLVIMDASGHTTEICLFLHADDCTASLELKV